MGKVEGKVEGGFVGGNLGMREVLIGKWMMMEEGEIYKWEVLRNRKKRWDWIIGFWLSKWRDWEF